MQPLYKALLEYRLAFDEISNSEDDNHIIEIGIDFLAKIHMLIENQGADPLEKSYGMSIQKRLESCMMDADAMIELELSDPGTKNHWSLHKSVLMHAVDIIEELTTTAPAHSLHAVYDSFIDGWHWNLHSYGMDYAGPNFLERFRCALESKDVDLYEERDGVSIMTRLLVHKEQEAITKDPAMQSFAGYCETAADLLEHEIEHTRLTKNMEALMMGSAVPRLREHSLVRHLPENVLQDIADRVIPKWEAFPEPEADSSS